jgi:hypothetical protein
MNDEARKAMMCTVTACRLPPQHNVCINLGAQRGRSRRADHGSEPFRAVREHCRRRRPLTCGRLRSRKKILHSPYRSCQDRKVASVSAWTLVTIFMLRHPETHLQVLQSSAPSSIRAFAVPPRRPHRAPLQASPHARITPLSRQVLALLSYIPRSPLFHLTLSATSRRPR